MKTRSKQTGNLLINAWLIFYPFNFGHFFNLPPAKSWIGALGVWYISYLVWKLKVPLAAVLGVFRICGQHVEAARTAAVPEACMLAISTWWATKKKGPHMVFVDFSWRQGGFLCWFREVSSFPGFFRSLLIYHDETTFFQIDFGVGWISHVFCCKDVYLLKKSHTWEMFHNKQKNKCLV